MFDWIIRKNGYDKYLMADGNWGPDVDAKHFPSQDAADKFAKSYSQSHYKLYPVLEENTEIIIDLEPEPEQEARRFIGGKVVIIEEIEWPSTRQTKPRPIHLPPGPQDDGPEQHARDADALSHRTPRI